LTVNVSKIIKDLGDRLLFVDDKIDLEANADNLSGDMLDKLYKIVKLIETNDRRKEEKKVEEEKRDIKRNEKVEGIIQTIKHVKESREKRSPKYIKKLLNKLTGIEGKDFTGTVRVDFEENQIIDVHLNELDTKDAELPEKVKISKQDIDYMYQYFDTPDNLSPELQELLVGIPKEKLEYARHKNVEHIVKKPYWKLDGTVGWEIIIPE